MTYVFWVHKIFIIPDKLAEKRGEVGADSYQYSDENIFEFHSLRVRDSVGVGKRNYYFFSSA